MAIGVDVPAANPVHLEAGARFGDFVAVEPIAAGGMAELYLAARGYGRGRKGELVAVKRMLPHLGWDPEFVRMFLEEVRIAASLSHPNIVRVVDFGVGEGGHYLAMEYLHGRTLRAIHKTLTEAGPLPAAFAIGVAIEIAAGLHAAHEHRDEHGNRVEVVHRDVTPSNVMVTFDGRVKLLDFGIARVTQQTQLTRAGTLKGKVGYMSPEQCRGDPVDRRSDVFGLGILLYELTVGRRAFFADNDFAVMGKVLDGDYVRPSQVIDSYPPALEQIVRTALAVHPENRFATAELFGLALQGFAGQHGLVCDAESRARVIRARFGDAPLPRIDLAALRRAERSRGAKRRWAILAGVGGLIGVLGFSVGMLARDRDTDPVDDGPAATNAATPTTSPDEPDDEDLEDDEDVDDSVVPARTSAATSEPAALPPPPPPPAPGAIETIDASTAERRAASKRGKTRKKTGSEAETDKADPDTLLPPTWRK